nr:zinc finger, CCHC-type [Tanacetum cinerariifolium]
MSVQVASFFGFLSELRPEHVCSGCFIFWPYALLIGLDHLLGKELELAIVDFIKFLKESLDDFSGVLGLEPNMNKSTIFFGNVKLGDQRKNLNVVPFKVGKFPVKYLGVPLITKRSSREECKQLLDKGDLARGKAKISWKTFVNLNVKEQAEQELLQTTRDFHSCKQEEGQSVSSYVLKMKGYIDNLERLGHPVTLGLG